MIRNLILALLCLASVSQAAIFTDNFETYPPGPLTYIRMGDRHVTINGADAVEGAYGPPAWGEVFLTPASVCDDIIVTLNPPVFSISFEVSSVPGAEDTPPIVACYSTVVLPYWSMTTGPGTMYATWPADKIGKGGAGYAFLGGKQIPVIDRCIIKNGTLGKITIQTHSLVP